MKTLKLTNWSLMIIAAIMLTGCGFKLRSGQALPAGYNQIYLSGTQDFSPLKRSMEEYLNRYEIPFVLSEPQTHPYSTVAIYLMPDTLDRRLLSLYPTGQVAEYELVLSIRYQVIFPGKEAQFIEFDVTREYQDDPDAILAKSRELELVLSELRQQAADRIIRMLPSQGSSNL
ncbi:LPS assembly lipoprotein LptE [Aliiglaciecola sp. LCG003]|uniref:LPS-assembly lipoprotein LptE n=1 Tax=Aliiglaciecola sp. LCG003 TaxID=3053655 RepID=UPI00257334A1|nr:LPS assembly lipoprotein LptE [Aliiglaciecola sp. LCG003]WJG07819.1 LPS assembly lipoprotein LptE [Aliiglaciecola sp. LCG003]